MYVKYEQLQEFISDELIHTKSIHSISATRILIGTTAIQAASETLIDLDNPSMGFVQIRVGFHSGSVLANVVGSRLPKYSSM